MSALYRTETVRTIERQWIDALGGGVLMDRAAAAVADAAATIARGLARATPIVALVGPGNNGGDALLALAKLRDRGFPVSALALSRQPPTAEDALAVWRQWHAAGGSVDPLDALPRWLERRPIVLDGLFGIGLGRALSGDAAQAVEQLNASLSAAAGRVLAVDVPSGIDANRGTVVGGSAGVAVRATLTVTMIADKPGLHTGAALDHVGELRVAGLGLDLADAPAADGELFALAQARAMSRPRARDSHKGSYGSVLVVGGATGTTGAALMAARGAQCAGAGKVYIASPDERVFDPAQPQLMTRAIDASPDGLDAVCIGCGLGQSEAARHVLERALRWPLPLVIDADALNLLSEEPALARRLAARRAPGVLTPHPLEAARLLGCSAGEVQADRPAAALAMARRYGAVALLKGAGTVVAAPGARLAIVGSGSPALATAGTGDVLAGAIAALLAGGLDAHSAARLGAWLHGCAGDLWQRRHPCGTGLSAARLPEMLIDALDALQ
jgi:hydroxyethylthiazole kinase-like uncharacterized protein yjeF